MKEYLLHILSCCEESFCMQIIMALFLQLKSVDHELDIMVEALYF